MKIKECLTRILELNGRAIAGTVILSHILSLTSNPYTIITSAIFVYAWVILPIIRD